MLYQRPSIALIALALASPSAQAQGHDDFAAPPHPVRGTAPVVHAGADAAMGVAHTPPLGEAFTVEAMAPLTGAPERARVRPLEPLERVYFTPDRTPGSEDLWIRGTSYKAKAGTNGFTYIPFLGSDVPRSFPVSFRLASATLSGAPLDLSDTAGVSHSAHRVVLDRGAVEVVYDFELEEVEQSFVLDAAGATGDLVLTLDVVTELDARADGAGFLFDGEFGGITYGAATVLDGAGRWAPVHAQLEGGQLRLTVDAAFLSSAEGQIVVDPLLNTFDVDSSMADQSRVDVAFDVDANEAIYVYEDRFSGTDVDLFSRNYDGNGDFVRGGYIDAGGSSWEDPSVANVGRDNVFLIVAARNDAGGRGEIVGFTMHALTYAVSSEILIGETFGLWSNSRPDVGGTSAFIVGAKFLVVWEREFNSTQTLPRMRTVDTDGTVSSLMIADTGTDVQMTEVVVSKSTGIPNMVNIWNVAYRRRNLATGNESIRGLQVNPLGAVIQPAHVLRLLPVGERAHNLDISDGLRYDGLDPTYLVSYDPFNAPDQDVNIMVCRNNIGIRHIDLTAREHGPEAASQVFTRLGTTWDKFLVTYLEYDSGEFQVYATTLDPIESTEIAISERRVHLGTAGPAVARGGAAIATRTSGGSSSREAAIGWTRLESPLGDYQINGANFHANNPAAPAIQYCRGNPNSTGDRGFIRVEGDRSVSNSKTIVCSALPPLQFGLLLSGSDVGFVPNPGGSQGTLCLSGQLGRYNASISQASADGVVSFAMDPTSIPSPTGMVAAMVGQLYQWQLWHRDSVGGAATSNYTNAVSILFR